MKAVPDNPRSILIIKLSSIGDLLLFTPALRALRRKWPSAKITLLTESRCAPVVRNNPDIDRVIEFPRAGAEKLLPAHPFRAFRILSRTIRLLRSEWYDMALDFQGLFKSWFFLMSARVSFRAGKGRFLLVNRKSPHKKKRVRHAVESYFELTGLVDVARPPGEVLRMVYLPGDGSDVLSPVAPYIVLAPFTLWKSKKWPFPSWIQLGKQLVENGFRVVVSGAPGDAVEANRISNAISPDTICAAGVIDLNGLGRLLNKAACLVSVDSASMHMASALGIPVIALFGPTDPVRTGPLGEKAVVLQGDCTAAGCRKRRCGNPVCMRSISADSVARTLLSVISG